MEGLKWVSQNNADYYLWAKCCLFDFLGFLPESEMLYSGGTPYVTDWRCIRLFLNNLSFTGGKVSISGVSILFLTPSLFGLREAPKIRKDDPMIGER
jgi:hypothetical protein